MRNKTLRDSNVEGFFGGRIFCALQMYWERGTLTELISSAARKLFFGKEASFASKTTLWLALITLWLALLTFWLALLTLDYRCLLLT